MSGNLTNDDRVHLPSPVVGHNNLDINKELTVRQNEIRNWPSNHLSSISW